MKVVEFLHHFALTVRDEAQIVSWKRRARKAVTDGIVNENALRVYHNSPQAKATYEKIRLTPNDERDAMIKKLSPLQATEFLIRHAEKMKDTYGFK